ncbi:hypothetical protein [cf. Phormidesmis sp. LEGE 11477]|uniref:hypothetical protein n=1 Tax=cf. Phormidesmis sp. LEGE 11477 TaxID=1828680 RepID=UPI001882C72D|nr:hypothetical protein [cf. Phormidesmis sp. LEGE 11477]MBE9063541.1 hypothetical protein [cf. Phormidesmis sp. LEGE 11477]
MPTKVLFYRVLALNLLAIALVILISYPFGQVEQQFKDGGFIDIFSGIQLFVIAYYAYRAFKARSAAFRSPWRSPGAIWGIISAGFVFLALDELATIHEGLDKLIHIVLNLQETGMSDRIDDLIVGLYGVIAIALLVVYRKELKRYKFVLPYVFGGFVLLFCMIGIDAISNRDDVFLAFFSAARSDSLMSWVFVPEEACKLVSEAFFVTAAKCCEQMGRDRAFTAHANTSTKSSQSPL